MLKRDRGQAPVTGMRGYFVPSDKLHDAVDAYGTFGHLVDKDVGRVHVFKGDAVGSVVELGPSSWPAPAFALASKPFRNIIYNNFISPKSFRGLNDLGPCEKI